MPRNMLRGAVWIIASAVAFMASNLLIRHLGTKLPPLEMALFRSAGGLIMLVVAWRAFLHLRQLRDPTIHGIRAAVGAVSLMALVHAYATLPVALVTVFLYLRPALVIVMARIFLRETAGRGIWAAVAVGLTGGIVALWPKLAAIGTPAFSPDVLVLPIAVVAGAGSHICLRRLGMTNPPSVVVAVSAVLISAVVAVPASTVAVVPPIGDAPLLVGMAALSGLAQWATVRGYLHESPARLAPLSMIDIPIALVGGYLIWGEVPTPHAAAGSALIILSALYVTRSESR